MKAAQHPLDFESLKRGDTISRKTLESITGFSYERNPREYDLALLQLRSTIVDQRPDLNDIVCVQGSLHVNTNEETVDATAKRLCKQTRDERRNLEKIAAVQIDKLSPEYQATAERLHTSASMRVLWLRKEQRRLAQRANLLTEGKD